MKHNLIVYDEYCGDYTHIERRIMKFHRKERAMFGWHNWYSNRGRISLNATKSELRRLSWRRAH